MDIYIYGLYNSFSSKIRYIGKTNNIQRRLSEHIYEAKKGIYSHFPKNKWILKTLDNGGKIFAKIIEITNEEFWEEREIYWISHYKDIGDNLNLSRGGETSNANFFISYDECKKWVKENLDPSVVNSESTWFKYVRTGNSLPDFIPRKPNSLYQYDGFNWMDFLGKSEPNYAILKKTYVKPDEIAEFVKKHNITTIKELTEKIKNEHIPNMPKNISRYLSLRGIKPTSLFKRFFTFDEFTEYLRTNFPNINSPHEYALQHKNMSKKAPFYYKEIYCDIENIDKILFKEKMTYDECKKIVLENNIKTPREYREFRKKNPNLKLPSHPDESYKKSGWTEWQDFLNVTLLHARKQCSFELFCRYMRVYHNNVKNSMDYKKMLENECISRRIPRRPNIKYNVMWGYIFNCIYGVNKDS